MEYFKYLSEIDFEKTNWRDFVLTIIGGIVVLKLFGMLLTYWATEEYERSEIKYTFLGGLFTNLFIVMVFLTIVDYNKNYEFNNFWFSNYHTVNSNISIKWDKDVTQSYTYKTSETTDNEKKPFNDFIWNDIQIDPEVDEGVNNSEIIQAMKFSNDELIKLKKILSDPNPNSENSDGTNCGRTTKNCKWCGKEMSENKLTTTQSFISTLISPYTLSIGVALKEGYGQKVDLEKDIEDSKMAILERINSYDVIKYTCVPNFDDFCSTKCEYEYKNK